MSNNDIITRVYREAIASYGVEGVDRKEAIESAVETLMIDVRAGRFTVDIERALRNDLRRADEADGRSADAILHRAAFGEVPLLTADLDVVVTLGAGRRKSWGDVTFDDLAAMNEIRYRNYKQARDAFEEFNGAFIRVREVLQEHTTFGAAFEAGGFPPKVTLLSESVAS